METTIPKGPATTGSATIAQTSRLLAVPREIRNRIYELAVEDTNAWPAEDFANITDELVRACKLRELRTLTTPHLRKQGTAEISWPTLKRKYLGLTQTCRQLRAETSGIHSKIWTRVNADELGDYTREFILKDVSDNKAAAGCIEVVGLQHRDDSRVDIRDFLLLYSEAPVNVQLRSNTSDRMLLVSLWYTKTQFQTTGRPLNPQVLMTRLGRPGWRNMDCLKTL